jgi:hypothetical protein
MGACALTLACLTPNLSSLGQHAQRPLNMNPNIAAGAYRNQYPTYAVPTRTVLPGGGGAAFLQQQQANHRTPAQNMIHQPSPGFMQQRGSSTYAFNSGLGQPQPSLQSHANPQQQQLHQQQQQQQQQTNGTVNSLPPHLSQRSITPGLAPSVSSNSEAGLDPNDFPALGSSTVPNNNTNAANAANSATSYASQAGATSIAPMNASSANAGSQGRDLTADDFPALGGGGGGGQQGLPTSQQAQETSQQPPGLNGFHQNEQQQQQQSQQRQNVISALGSGMVQQSGTPGMLNLGAARAAYQLGQSEAEKRVSLYVSFFFLFFLGFCHYIYVPALLIDLSSCRRCSLAFFPSSFWAHGNARIISHRSLIRQLRPHGTRQTQIPQAIHNLSITHPQLPLHNNLLKRMALTLRHRLLHLHKMHHLPLPRQRWALRQVFLYRVGQTSLIHNNSLHTPMVRRILKRRLSRSSSALQIDGVFSALWP